jgi:hypothetical protein
MSPFTDHYLHQVPFIPVHYLHFRQQNTRKSIQKLAKGKSTEEQKCQHAKKVSPSPSISGSSLKSTDEMCQEEEIEKVLFQIKCYDSNRNTSQLVVGVC